MLKSYGLKISNPDYVKEKEAKLPLEGLTFVITGTLPRPRKEVEGLIAGRGGRAAGSVSGSTDYLVAGENPGSKKKKAEELGVKVISYNKLVTMLK
jgi:DNA ligase (NAD+)